jgi:hypothetical protein
VEWTEEYEDDSPNSKVKGETLIKASSIRSLASVLQALINRINQECIRENEPLWEGGPALGAVAGYNDLCGATFTIRQGPWVTEERTEAEEAALAATRDYMRYWIQRSYPSSGVTSANVSDEGDDQLHFTDRA